MNVVYIDSYIITTKYDTGIECFIAWCDRTSYTGIGSTPEKAKEDLKHFITTQLDRK